MKPHHVNLNVPGDCTASPLGLNNMFVLQEVFLFPYMRSSPEEPHLTARLVTFSLFLVTSDISPELLSHAPGLKLKYVGVRAWGSKLPLAIHGNRPDLWHHKLWP